MQASLSAAAHGTLKSFHGQVYADAAKATLDTMGDHGGFASLKFHAHAAHIDESTVKPGGCASGKCGGGSSSATSDASHGENLPPGQYHCGLGGGLASIDCNTVNFNTDSFSFCMSKYPGALMSDVDMACVENCRAAVTACLLDDGEPGGGPPTTDSPTTTSTSGGKV